MTVEGVKTVFDWVVVVLAGLTFISIAVVLITGNIINKRQADQLREFDQGLTAAKTELGKQQERAANADARVAGLEKDASNAKADAARSLEHAEQAKNEAAKAIERAAVAEKALLELKERIKPRRLTDQQSAAFVNALKAFPNGEVKLGYTAGSADEGFNLAKQLLPLFIQAGWKGPKDTRELSNHLEIQVTGAAALIRIPASPQISPGQFMMTPILATLKSAFHAAGLGLDFMNYHPAEGDIPEIVIGSKPEPTSPN